MRSAEPSERPQAGGGPALVRPGRSAVQGFLRELAREAPDAEVIEDPDQLEPFTRDWSGATPCWPDAAVRPAGPQSVARVLRAAENHRIPVTPRGLGSGKSGGALPVMGGVVLDVSGWTGVVEVSGADLLAVVRAGTATADVYRAAESEGLFYAPDPNSAHLCSIGGNVACNAGGPRAVKYGVTKHHVLGLEVVTPSAGVQRLGGRSVKRATGYDLTSLMVGSEGTLGVITEVTVRLLPEPRGLQTALIAFDDAMAATEAVTRVLQSGILPRALEFLDEAATDAVRNAQAGLLDERFGATLIAETDGPTESDAEAQLERLADVVLDAGAKDVRVARTPAQRERIWGPRRLLSESLRATAPRKLSEDVSVPRSRIPELLRAVRAVGTATGIRVAAYGHAGDGNLHVNLLFDEDQLPAARQALERVAEAAVKLGGTISGEHGVGLLKRDLLSIEQPQELIWLQQSLKRTFDPHQILNPGKIFPGRGARE
ncbi:MAG TPA: FAD-linked oxidase C-terminal domain-containing protein [Myxococcales bacterium LLY-WYZ-16_1]|nr:FAD-linked oxidase C-terminal domain-containing protein [Myxococcales bacterium LLY-WYZ-16_1]